VYEPSFHPDFLYLPFTFSLRRYAGNKSRFGIAESTFHAILHRAMDYLLGIAAVVIKFPRTNDEKIKIANDFEQVGI
jgi:hypothetical protein